MRDPAKDVIRALGAPRPIVVIMPMSIGFPTSLSFDPTEASLDVLAQLKREFDEENAGLARYREHQRSLAKVGNRSGSRSRRSSL